jgi:hypothetical protein
MDEKEILVTLNPIGYKIESHEIDGILDFNNKYYDVHRNNIADFFLIESKLLTKDLLVKYAETCKAMTNISMGSYQSEIRKKLIDTLSSAKRCFCYREYLASIELCALHGEMLANFLCIINKDSLQDASVIDLLELNIKNSIRKCLTDANFYDALNQLHRIAWLKAGKTITKDNQNFTQVHKVRIKYFHHWGQPAEEVEADALNVLTFISEESAKHLELFNNPENISKIQIYLNSI